MNRHNERGVVLIITLVFGALLIAMSASLVNYTTLHARASRLSVGGTQARALAEAGIDAAIYALNHNPSYAGETDTALGEGTYTVTVQSINSAQKRIIADGYVPDRTHPLSHARVIVQASKDVSVVAFHFGVQSGDGGFDLENNSSVEGNVYSNGPLTGENSNEIDGSAVSAGASGLIDGIHVTGDAYAHTITDADIGGDAYFQTITSSEVDGTEHGSSVDQATSTFPISDTMIAEWEDAAAAGGTHTTPCPYTIQSSITLGPKKINCDVTIKGNGTILTLEGPVWVNGNITIEGSPTIRAGFSLGDESVALIADKTADRTNGSIVMIKNSPTFEGSGTAGSYVLVVSANTSAEAGGSNTAISAQNSVTGDLILHAGHGIVSLENSIALREVTAWRVELKNTASVSYDSGLGSTLFSTGPGGSWTVLPGTYSLTP